MRSSALRPRCSYITWSHALGRGRQVTHRPPNFQHSPSHQNRHGTNFLEAARDATTVPRTRQWMSAQIFEVWYIRERNRTDWRVMINTLSQLECKTLSEFLIWRQKNTSYFNGFVSIFPPRGWKRSGPSEPLFVVVILVVVLNWTLPKHWNTDGCTA